MAQTLASGVVIPAPGDRISASGVQEMRTLGASVDTGLSAAQAQVAQVDAQSRARDADLADQVAGMEGMTYVGAWESGGTYRINDVVTHGGDSWARLTAGSAGEPGASPTDWGLVARKGDGGGFGELSETEVAGLYDPVPAVIPDAYQVAVQQGYAGTVEDWLADQKGEPGPEGPYGGTEVTDPQVASWVNDEGSDTSEALDARLVAQARPVPTDEVVTATPVQHPLPAATPHDAFPGLTRTGDGSYLAAWRGGAGHNSSDGTVYLSRSWDGRAWSVPVAVPSDVHPDGDARDVSVSQLGEYTTLTYYSAGANLSYLRKSTDNGATWGPSIYLPFNSGGLEFISAPAVEVGGAWLVVAYGNSAVRVLRSTDQGETWSAPIVVATGGVQEPNLIPLDGEHVRAVWRTNYDGIAKTALSTDGGLTWGPASDAYWGQGNPHLVRLRSGAVVSTYKSSAGHSTNRYSYACTRISFDGGATWGPETVFGYASRKMAYAQAVETDIDGEMLCVWSAETSNTAARLYSVRLTHGGAITRGGEAPSPVTPRPGIARQILSLQKSSDQVISPSTWTPVEWEDERADHWEGFNPSRSLTDFKVDETGLYIVTFRASWNSVTPFTLGINPPAGQRQILHNSWDDGSEGVLRDGTLSGVVELEEGVAYQAQVRHRTADSERRLLSGDYAYRTRLSVAKMKGF